MKLNAILAAAFVALLITGASCGLLNDAEIRRPSMQQVNK